MAGMSRPAESKAAEAQPATSPAAKTEAKTAASPAAQTAAKPADDGFYADKTVRIITGFTPRCLFDRWSRLLAKHMPRYIPATPRWS
jgi:hypothetical protein